MHARTGAHVFRTSPFLQTLHAQFSDWMSVPARDSNAIPLGNNNVAHYFSHIRAHGPRAFEMALREQDTRGEPVKPKVAEQDRSKDEKYGRNIDRAKYEKYPKDVS